MKDNYPVAVVCHNQQTFHQMVTYGFKSEDVLQYHKSKGILLTKEGVYIRVLTSRGGGDLLGQRFSDVRFLTYGDDEFMVNLLSRVHSKKFDLKGKVILLNSPFNCGKDEAAKVIKKMTGAKHCEFKSTLFNIAKGVTGLSHEEFFEIYNDRELKENPHLKFHGKSPRDLMIWISEDVCKPEFGDEFFGNAAANSLDVSKGSVFSDSGFEKEVFPLAEKVGAENIYIIQFTRHGKTFEGDSRGFLQKENLPEGVNVIKLSNDGEGIESFAHEILEAIQSKKSKIDLIDKLHQEQTFHVL